MGEHSGGERERENELHTHYKLIYVGAPFKNDEFDLFVMPCYFQPWQYPQDLPLDLPIVVRNINSNIAGELICGSLWTKSLHIDKTTYHNNADSHFFWTRGTTLHTVLLNNLINPSALTPASFWSKQEGVWVICIKDGKKKIIIPYFELLRVLFYQAGKRLTQFFLSFLPLELLCRPVSFPNRKNLLTARFYVSSKTLTKLEARILGGLLFDPSLKEILDLSYNHWLHAHILGATQRKSVGKFKTGILFNATGYHFTYDNTQYLWVNSLDIINSPYNFQHLLFYPIEGNKTNSSASKDSFICSDLLSYNTSSLRTLNTYSYPSTINFEKLKPSVINTRNAKKYPALSSPNLPSVTRGLPWANTPKINRVFYWLDKELAARVEYLEKDNYKDTIKYTIDFHKIITNFKEAGHPVEYLTLNNPKSIFGKNISILPVNHNPPLPLAIYRGTIKIFTAVKISLINTSLFLIQPFPENNPQLILLCQKQDLSIPEDWEWNNLFDILTPIYTYSEFSEFYKNCKRINRSTTSISLSLIALALPIKNITMELCISFSNHLLSKFRSRLQFNLAALLKYPNGMSRTQHKELARLSYNICKAPDSIWITRVFRHWRISDRLQEASRKS